MTDQTVTLRIVGENGQLVGVIRATKAELGGLGKSAGDAGAQARVGARGIDAVGEASERTRRRATLLGGTLGQLKGLLGGVVLAQTIRDLGRTADAYTDINGKLQQVTSSERELANARATTFKISQDTFQAWGDTVTLYQRSAQALEQYGASQATVAALTTTINQGLLVSRATAAESASAILQLSQSLGAGALRGEEFNAVNEAAPRLMEALAKSMDVPRGALKALAEEGKLTIDVLLKAWTGPEAARIAEEASKVPLTMARAWRQVRNDVLKNLGETDQRVGASGAVANNLGVILLTLAKAAVAVAVVYGGRLAAALILSARQFIINEAAATQAYIATMRLNTGATATAAIMTRVGTGVRSLGSGLIAFAGGPIGIAVIAIGALIAKFISARAEAENLRKEVANAIAESQSFQDTRDLSTALSAGKQLLAQRQTLQDDIDRRRASLALEQFSPSARASGVLAGHRQDLAQQEVQLAEVNRQLGLNATLIERVSAARAKQQTTASAATRQSAEFNEQLGDQNEKLKVERIEREQGLRAALEYQAMQATGATTIGQLSQATRDLIDTQVRETTAADAYKDAQKAAGDAAKGATTATKEQHESQLQYADALELARAELAGPLAQAQAQHDQAIRKLNQDYAVGNVGLKEWIGLKDVEDQKLRSVTDELARNQDILGQIHADYAQQIAMSGLSAEAYRVEEEMIRRRNDALQNRVTITPELEASWRAEITQGERQLAVADAARRAAQQFQDSWTNATESAWRATGDFITRSIHSWKDFGHALVDIGKRWGSDLIAQWGENGGLSTAIRKLFSGGFADAGSTGSSSLIAGIAQAAGGNSGGGMLATIGRLFGLGGGNAPAATGTGWGSAYGAAAGQLAAGAGVMLPQYGGGALVAAQGAAAGGGMGMSSLGMLGSFKSGTLGKFLTSPAAPWLGAAAGAYYGYRSTDDPTGKVLAGAAYGAAGYGVMAGVGGAVTGSAVAGSAAAGLSAVPVVGWIALAAIAIDKLSGGKLFGTKYKMDSATTNYAYGDAGITGLTDVEKSRQEALFGGTKRTTDQQVLTEEARAALGDAFSAIDDAVVQAAGQLGVATPTLIAASFAQTFDSKGKLKTEFGTIAGQVYNEAQDAFNKRYLAENLLNVAGLAGGHATAVDQLANGYRGSADALTDLATAMLAIAGDAKAGTLLWADTDAALTTAVGTLEGMRHAGEQLAATYGRVSEATRAYGSFIAGIRTELDTHGLSDYAKAQLDVELGYRSQVKQANDLAKALGLSGARSEDLASIELLRAQRMGDLQQQMEAQRDQFLGDLRLSDLGIGTDQDKLGDAMQQLQAAVAGGDLQRAQQMAQQALGFGRNLMASGSDYNALYGRVTGMLGGLDPAGSGLADSALQQLADTMDTLPEDIAAAMFNVLAQQTPLPPPPAPPSSGPGSRDPIRNNPKTDRGLDTGSDPRVLDALERTAAGINALRDEARSATLRERNRRPA